MLPTFIKEANVCTYMTNEMQILYNIEVNYVNCKRTKLIRFMLRLVILLIHFNLIIIYVYLLCFFYLTECWAQFLVKSTNRFIAVSRDTTR